MALNSGIDMEDLTPEQRKQIEKIVYKARLNLLGIGAKFAFGLFGANLICILTACVFLKDVDPEQIVGFEMVCMVINFLFMTTFIYRQLKANSDMVREKIKEVLKK